jgi:hypothetical protein
MPTELIAALVIMAVGLLFPAADTLMRRRALRRDRNWLCARCDKPLLGTQSELVPVAGGMHTPIDARMCAPCAKRDKRIRRITYAGLLAAFALTIGLLSLASGQ